MSLKEPIPLLRLFEHWQPTGYLGELARDCTVRDFRLHQKERTAELEVTFASAEPDPASLRAMGTVLSGCYGMNGVTLIYEQPQPVPEEEYQPLPSAESTEEERPPLPEEAPPEREEPFQPEEEPPVSDGDVFRQTAALREAALREVAAHQPSSGAAKKQRRETPQAPVGNMIFGKGIHRKPMPMSQVTLDMGMVAVCGKVFLVEHRELPKRKAWVVNFYITDYTNSLVVARFLENRQAQPILDQIKVGMYVIVEGKLGINSYSGEMELSPYAIAPAKAPKGRMDNAREKRVELHLHTRFSTMDGLTEIKDAVKRAISWGHSAIAVTDHGVAQAFPDAWHAAVDKIKILYGVEAYYINDVDDRVVVHGDSTASLDDEIVCFDIETTGLSQERDRITEIGAVVLRNGQVEERYNTFVNPGRPIPREVVELTSITDDMVKDAPSQSEALNDF
ncbi:MAG: PHP domain-containing protein, partial [Clostridiales bacterium]|nr:PHP domain-containing protein [Clostridiales bacterium]